MSHVAVQFPLYETFKKWAHDAREDPKQDLDASTILLCSTTAKMIASVTTYPHEVLRTRLQMQPNVARVANSPRASDPPSSTRRIHTLARRDARPVSVGAAFGAQGIWSRPGERSGAHSGVRYVGVVETCSRIWREEGVRGFYRGMTVNLIRTLPSSALTILT